MGKWKAYNKIVEIKLNISEITVNVNAITLPILSIKFQTEHTTLMRISGGFTYKWSFTKLCMSIRETQGIVQLLGVSIFEILITCNSKGLEGGKSWCTESYVEEASLSVLQHDLLRRQPSE